jgi:hypothetical protein
METVNVHEAKTHFSRLLDRAQEGEEFVIAKAGARPRAKRVLRVAGDGGACGARRRVAGIHGDPFDRLLVAQSLAEPMTLLTNDTVLAGYGPLVELV